MFVHKNRTRDDMASEQSFPLENKRKNTIIVTRPLWISEQHPNRCLSQRRFEKEYKNREFLCLDWRIPNMRENLSLKALNWNVSPLFPTFLCFRSTLWLTRSLRVCGAFSISVLQPDTPPQFIPDSHYPLFDQNSFSQVHELSLHWVISALIHFR